jgi:hypothetical protein
MVARVGHDRKINQGAAQLDSDLGFLGCCHLKISYVVEV